MYNHEYVEPDPEELDNIPIGIDIDPDTGEEYPFNEDDYNVEL